mgnify:CR=1 FL=1
MPSTPKSSEPLRIRVVAGAIIRNGAVLVAQRARSAEQAGLWELPGGKVQRGESDAMALVRELQEELGITVAVTGLLGVSDHDYPAISIRLIGLCGHILSGEPQAREHSAIQWIGPDELKTLSWSPADVALLEPLEVWLRSI